MRQRKSASAMAEKVATTVMAAVMAALRIAAPLQRLENLHQFFVDELIAADHMPGLQRVVIAFHA